MPSAGISTKITKNELPNLPGRLRSQVGGAQQRFVRRVATTAKQRVHVITGQLRDSIEDIKLDEFTYAVVAGNADREFWDAWAEEFGTSRRPPHSFLLPSWEAEKGAYLDELDGIIERSIP